MKKIYLEDSNKLLKRFVCGINEKEEDDDDCATLVFTSVSVISEKSFVSSDVNQIVFENALTTIKMEAFKDSEDLEIFCCGKVGGDTKIENAAGTIKGVEIYDAQSDFAIETSAFAGCDSLHTVILPKCKTLKIEKNVFLECSSLRTVVALPEEIEFTENPFRDCPKDLTFVCKSNSYVERFARENGYGYINV